LNQVLIANQREIVQLLPMAECIEVMAGVLQALTVVQARLYVDRRESTLHEAGEFRIPKSEGRIGDEHIVGELGEVLSGKAPGRGSPGESPFLRRWGSLSRTGPPPIMCSKRRAKGIRAPG